MAFTSVCVGKGNFTYELSDFKINIHLGKYTFPLKYRFIRLREICIY